MTKKVSAHYVAVIVVRCDNRMLQPSVDRIDSANGAYDATNVQITHPACNLAKNKYGSGDFAEWLRTIKSDARIER